MEREFCLNAIYIDIIYTTRILKACCFCVFCGVTGVSTCFFSRGKKNHGISFVSLSLCPERHRIELEKILEFGLDGRLCDVARNIFQPLISFYLSERDSYFDDRHGMNKSRLGLPFSRRGRGGRRDAEDRLCVFFLSRRCCQQGLILCRES